MSNKNENSTKKVSIITLDLLTISVITSKKLHIEVENEVKKINNHLELQATNRKTQMFRDVWDVIYQGMNVGTLETNPSCGSLDQNWCRFRYSNEILYTESISKIYNKLKSALNWKFQRFSQLDIATDTPSNGKDFQIFDKFCRKDISILGNFKKSAEWGKNDEMHYFRLGSKKSDKFIRCYYKRQEIEQSGKQYISEYFEKNNFDKKKEVFRVELSISTGLMSKIFMPEYGTNMIDHETGEISPNHSFPFLEEHTIYRLEDHDFLASIFNSEVSDKLKFIRTNELRKKGRTNRCKRFKMFNFDFANKVYKLKRIKNEVTKYIYRTKVTSKMMYQCFLETKNKNYKRIAEELLNNAGLYGFIDKLEHLWIDEYEKKKKNKMYKTFMSKLNDLVIMQKEDLKFIQSRL